MGGRKDGVWGRKKIGRRKGEKKRERIRITMGKFYFDL